MHGMHEFLCIHKEIPPNKATVQRSSLIKQLSSQTHWYLLISFISGPLSVEIATDGGWHLYRSNIRTEIMEKRTVPESISYDPVEKQREYPPQYITQDYSHFITFYCIK